MFWTKPEDDTGLNGADYTVITMIEWRFLCFIWTQKIVKAIRKVKEGEVLRAPSIL